MNQRIKKLWVEALRSGKYKQGKNALRVDGAFCCLGVLCDIYHEYVGGQWLGSSFIIEDNVDSMSQLPKPVAVWAGLERANPELGDYDAIMLNDSGHTFTEIADRIERYL